MKHVCLNWSKKQLKSEIRRSRNGREKAQRLRETELGMQKQRQTGIGKGERERESTDLVQSRTPEMSTQTTTINTTTIHERSTYTKNMDKINRKGTTATRSV